MKVLVCYVFLVLSLEWCNVLCRKNLPITEERAHRKLHTNSECVFGKQHKELGSTWFADLGPPFDVMYCVKCECMKVFREGRLFAHVNCSNIGKDCPELTCDDQIQVVGRCCKVCRNDIELTQVLQDVTPPNAAEEEEKSYKHYAALLTNTFYTLHKDSDNASFSVTSYGQTATGRFTLHRRNLYFSFYSSMFPLPTRPKTVQFVDNAGNILEEQQISSSGSLYQNLTNKICGVWRRVPGEYRSLLKDEKLSVVLMWDEYDVRIRGGLMRYRPLTTEILSSLMVASNDSLTDAAGTAMVTISTTLTPTVPMIHVMVVFTGLLSVKRKNDNSLLLRLFTEDKTTAVFEETISVEKPSPELNVVEYSTALSAEDLQALTQQRLSLSLVSSKYRDSKIQGKVFSRVHCELFQAVLSSQHQNQPNAKYTQKSNKGGGLAWMFFDWNNALRYYVTVDNAVDASVELVTARHLNKVEDLPVIGLSNATVSSLDAKYLQLLYDEELAVNVVKTSGNNPSVIRGRLISRPVADSRDSPTPFLMKRSDSSVPSDMVGLIWARIDPDECNLQYDISIAGKEVDDFQFELFLEDIPFLAPGAPVSRRWLEEFNGSSKEGFSSALPQNGLSRLETGIVYLDLWDIKRGQSVLKTKWDKISIPQSCLPRNSENSTADNNIPSYRLLHEENDQPEVTKCFDGSQFYDHDTQWTSTTENCTMCHCNRGVTKCDLILCPDLSCAQKYAVPGSCCPSCSNVSNTSQNRCSLGGQTFAAGSAWYPYIPPNGFATCTVCHCDVTSLQVKCGRVECPPLTCEERIAFRPDKKSCCKICPNMTRGQGYDIAISDQQDLSKYERDILIAGGCKYPFGGPYENGKEWHPRIHFHGEQKCVTCRCKDGKVTCERKKCVKYTCDDPCCMKIKAKCGGKSSKRNLEEGRKPERV